MFYRFRVFPGAFGRGHSLCRNMWGRDQCFSSGHSFYKDTWMDVITVYVGTSGSGCGQCVWRNIWVWSQIVQEYVRV